MLLLVRSSPALKSQVVRCLAPASITSLLFRPDLNASNYKHSSNSHVRLFSSSSIPADSQSLRPYVDPVFSYAYGRSTGYLEHKTITRCFKQNVSGYPDRLAIISQHQNIQKTFAQLNDDVEKIASALLDMGLRKGDVGGVWSSNLYEYAVAQYALIRIGAVSCSISPVYKSGELEYALQKAKHKVIFLPTKESRQSVINDFSAVLAGVDREKVPDLQHLVYLETSGTSAELETFSGSYKAHSFNELLASTGQKVPAEVEEAVDSDDPATIYFTSGTTGKPKGAIVSHFSITNNLRNVMTRKEITAEDEPVICLPLPLFHVYAGTVGLFSLSVMPCTLVFVDIRYTAKSVLEAIGRYKCTDLWVVPTQLVDINNHIKNRPNKYDLSSLRNIGAGAAPVPVEVAKESTELFPKLQQMLVGYGATETSAIATYPTKHVPQETALETVGSPMDFTQVKIVDASGKMVEHGETGELLVKGYTVMQGYLDEKAKTEECIRNGWYHTGDLATMDANGIFKIVGRTKEMIIRGGSNIYPREIEELLHEHPQILEAAVCGVPNPKLGEEVCAWVQLRDDKSGLTDQDVKDFCRDRISYYKVPAHVIFVKDFPRTLSGKFQKFKMTEQSVEILKLDVKK